MIPETPVLIPEPFAEDGSKNVIPAQSPGASEPNASWNLGFPPITMLNRQAGGKPPLGADFNGILHALSQHLYWLQSGGGYEWSDVLDYPQGAVIQGEDGRMYRALLPSGPGVAGVGPKNPVSSSTESYWQDFGTWLTGSASGVPRGHVSAFYRVTLGGSDGRRPIFWGNDEADEGWVLCDGGSDGDGGVVPDLRGRMILGASDAYPEYSGGGSASHTHTVSGTVGATTLSQAQMPSHTHQSWAGRSTSTAAGIAVTPAGQNHYISDGIGNTGGNGSHTHSLANAATGQASSMPPYYALSYFVKI